jgi:hypothetical protein
VVLAVASSALAAGCGGSANESAWCKAIKQQRDAFDVKKPNDPEAQAEFARLAAQAPPEIRGDLDLIARYSPRLWAGDLTFWRDKGRTDEYIATVERVDRYLHDECHVSLPSRVEERPDRSTSD